MTAAISKALLVAKDLRLVTPEGRTLISGLNLSISKEKVAVVGRNGVGKSSLLDVLAGKATPCEGTIASFASRGHVPQLLPSSAAALMDGIDELAGVAQELAELHLPPLDELRERRELSPGEGRKLSLLRAFEACPELLVLDEPGQDLDQEGTRWLTQRLADYEGGLLVASHQEQVLSTFEHFFVVAEAGCWYFAGSLQALREQMQSRNAAVDTKYLRSLTRLARKEEHSALVARRRRRKKMGGRVREIGRAPSRAMLNTKRSYAQKYQAKREKARAERIDAARLWTKAARRALEVRLALAPTVPVLPPDKGLPNLRLEAISLRVGARQLFANLDLQIGRQRVAITGPNGSGKTSLLKIMEGEGTPDEGRVFRRNSRIASISQGARSWMVDQSLISLLLASSTSGSADEVAERLVSHKFPLALAARPLRSLSPGERVRAALLCIFERERAPELLLLDEPTYSLDQVGAMALRQILRRYSGGIVVASHDREFLRSIGIERELILGVPAAPLLEKEDCVWEGLSEESRSILMG